MRILVCGGRFYCDRDAAFMALDRAHDRYGITHIIHGAAGGADTLSAEWARQRGIDATAYPADWKAHGKGAGPMRNQRMLDEASPDGAIAFPGGRGTADMIDRCTRAGVKVWLPFGQ